MVRISPEYLFDVTDGELVPGLSLQVDNGYITKIEENDGIVDLPGITILPGFIDCHVHITYHYDANGRFGWEDPSRTQLLEYGIKNLQNTLRAGFTTIRDAGTDNDLDLILRGTGVGPRMYVCGRPVFDPNETVDGRIAKGVDAIKIFNTNADLERIVRHGLPVSVHAFDPDTIVKCSRIGCASIEHGSYLDDRAAKIMADNGTILVPTLSMPRHYLSNRDRFRFTDRDWRHFEDIDRSGRTAIDVARRNGVKIAFGTDSVAGMHGHNMGEFRLLEDAGMSRLEALQSATINAADLLRVPDIGRIGVDYRADLIGLYGNPLVDNLENIAFVVKDGVMVER